MENQLQQLQHATQRKYNKNILVVLSPDAERYLEKLKQKSDKVQYITPYDFKELKDTGKVPQDVGQSENIVLQIDPISKQYTKRTSTRDDEIISERIFQLKEIIGLLGGLNLVIQQEEKQKDSNNTKVDIQSSVSAPIVSVDTNVQYDKNNKSDSHQKIETITKFSGIYTRKSYEEAKRRAMKYGLDSNSYITHLLNQRRPDNNPRPIERDEYHTKIQDDLQCNLAVAADLKVKCKEVVGIDLDVDIQNGREQSKYTSLDICVEFGPLVDEEGNIIDNNCTIPYDETKQLILGNQQRIERIDLQLGTTRTNLQTDIATINNNLTTAQENITNLQTNIAITNGNLATAKEDITNLQTNIAITNDNLATAKEDITNLQTDIATTNGNLATAKEDITNLQTDIATTNGNLTSSKEELSTQIDRLQKEIEVAETDNKSMKRQLIWLACVMAVFCAVTIITTILVSTVYYKYF